MKTASAPPTASARFVVNDSRPCRTFAATSSSRPGSKIGISPALQGVDLAGVLVDAGHLMAEIGKAGAGDQADIARADHGNLHLRCSNKAPARTANWVRLAPPLSKSRPWGQSHSPGKVNVAPFPYPLAATRAPGALLAAGGTWIDGPVSPRLRRRGSGITVMDNGAAR